jgi:hypothetical protein
LGPAWPRCHRRPPQSPTAIRFAAPSVCTALPGSQPRGEGGVRARLAGEDGGHPRGRGAWRTSTIEGQSAGAYSAIRRAPSWSGLLRNKGFACDWAPAHCSTTNQGSEDHRRLVRPRQQRRRRLVLRQELPEPRLSTSFRMPAQALRSSGPASSSSYEKSMAALASIGGSPRRELA